jgi:predicted TIM-barrel fold metal-dependent hydrolase
VIEPPDVQPYVETRDYTPPPASLSDYQRLHRTLGIERAVIVQPSFYGTDNTVTLRAIRDYGPNCRGIAVVDDHIPDAALEDLHSQGIRGIRYNLVFAGGVGLDSLDRMAARVAPLGWNVQLLVNAQTILEVEPQLRSLPAPVVIDHMGLVDARLGAEQPAVHAMRRLVSAGKTWVKVSGNYRLSQDKPTFSDVVPIARALIAEGPERMVWGTDWPHPALYDFMPEDGPLLDVVFTYASDADQARRILVDNPAKLYGFPS